MRASRPAIAVTIAGAALLVTGCTYHNTVYNAGRIFDRAEMSRRAGRDSLAGALYREVADKTEAAYRARPSTDWAADVLVLLGRSRYRIGELEEAEAALAEAERIARPELRGPVRVYLAEVRGALGDREAALRGVDAALEGGLTGEARAEAHLARGEWLLGRGQTDRGWWDLDRAVEAARATRVEAGLARLRWAVHDGDRARARQALDLLVSYPEGGDRLVAVTGLIASATERWGPAVSADLVAGAGDATWDRVPRGRLRLERARLLHEVGDSASASAEAWEVARTLGDAAAEARLLLARWHLDSTEDLADAYAVRGILLPAGADPEAAELVRAVDELEVYTDIGLGEPLGWFAAGEVARDRLHADYLARGLFLAYADGAPEEPWAPKALLAALEVSPTEDDRAWLRGRLEAHAESPYVLAALGGPSAGFEALEEELDVRLRGLRGR